MSDRTSKDGERQRACPRHKLFQPTVMAIDAARTRAHLLDLSAQGALVHAATLPDEGMVVRLECAGRMRTARVVWRKGSRFGVSFALALSDDQVAATLAEQRAGVTAHAARPAAVA